MGVTPWFGGNAQAPGGEASYASMAPWTMASRVLASSSHQGCRLSTPGAGRKSAFWASVKATAPETGLPSQLVGTVTSDESPLEEDDYETPVGVALTALCIPTGYVLGWLLARALSLLKASCGF